MTYDGFAEMVRQALARCHRHVLEGAKPDANCLAIELFIKLREAEVRDRQMDRVGSATAAAAFFCVPNPQAAQMAGPGGGENK